MEKSLVKKKFADTKQITPLKSLMAFASSRGWGAVAREGIGGPKIYVKTFEVENRMYQFNGYLYAFDFFRLTKSGSLELRGNILMPVEGELSKDFFINISTTLTGEILVQLSHDSKTHTVEFMHDYHLNQLMGTVEMDMGFYIPLAWLLQPMCDVVKTYNRV